MKYGTVIADPPWNYSRTSNNPKLRGYSDKHYEPLTTDDLIKLPVSNIVADRAVLFLWTTGPFLADGSAQRVAEAWGFKPVSLLYWHKLTDFGGSHLGGVGYWFRGNCEPILLAKRGAAFRWSEMPDWNKWQKSALFESKKGKHSEKPDHLHELIESSIYPKPYLEMFGRRERDNWTVVGNNGDGGTLSIAEDIQHSIDRLAALPEQLVLPEAV